MNKQVIILCSIVLAAPYAMASDYPTSRYDATCQVTDYPVNGPKHSSELRLASDGKGHYLVQTPTMGVQFRSLVDYIKRTRTSFLESDKKARITKLAADEHYESSEEMFRRKGSQAIGSKTISGHPCHGYECSDKAGIKSQIWIGDDCKVMVQSITNSASGKTVTELKSFTNSPSAAIFKVPQSAIPLTNK